MKQTAITISLNRTNSAVDGEQRMTSVEIAELTGKQHCHVMEEKNSARLLRRNRADKY
jgi:phage regulator Rha-like protein